jgi:hypothetical protein
MLADDSVAAPRVLVVDDDTDAQTALVDVLELAGFTSRSRAMASRPWAGRSRALST